MLGVHNSLHMSLTQPVGWVLGALVIGSSLTYHVDRPTSVSLDHFPLPRHSNFCVANPVLEDTAYILGVSSLLLSLYISYLNVKI